MRNKFVSYIKHQCREFYSIIIGDETTAEKLQREADERMKKALYERAVKAGSWRKNYDVFTNQYGGGYSVPAASKTRGEA